VLIRHKKSVSRNVRLGFAQGRKGDPSTDFFHDVFCLSDKSRFGKPLSFSLQLKYIIFILSFRYTGEKMSEQTITVTLPTAIFERIQTAAKATSLTSEEVIQQSVMLLLPALESNLPPKLRSELNKLALLNDIQLWKAANSVMPESQQLHLEKLAELQRHRVLTEIEQSKLDSLMNEAEQIMLCKAEARRLLAQRGHDLFQTVEH
jgi:hypothetical protein